MAFAVVQSMNSGSGGQAGISKSNSFASPVTAGNLLIYVSTSGTTGGVQHVYDNLESRWTFAKFFNSAAGFVQCWYAMAADAGTCTVTQVHDVAVTSWTALIEVSGFSYAEIDAISAGSAQAGTTNHPGGSLTTTVNDTYILGAAVVSGAFSATAAGSFTMRQATTQAMYTQDQIATSTVTTTGTFTTAANESSAAFLIAFKDGTAPTFNEDVSQTFFSRGFQSGGNRNDIIALSHQWLNSSTNTPPMLPVSITVRNLIVRADTLQAGAGTIVFSLRKNLGDTPLSVTLTNAGGLYYENLTDSVYFAAGSAIGFHAVTTSATGTTLTISFDVIGDEPNISIYAERCNTFAPDPAYWAALHQGCESVGTGCSSSTAGDTVENPAGIAGSVVGVGYAKGTASSCTLNLLLNGVLQDGSGSTVNTTITQSATSGYGLFNLPFVELDSLVLRHTGDEIRSWCVAVQSTNPNYFSQGGNSQSEINNTATPDYWMPHAGGQLESATETAVALYVGVTPITIRGLYVKVDAPGTGKSIIVTLYVNGVITAFTTTISDAATIGSFTGELTLEPGDRYALEQHATGSPTLAPAPMRWTFVGVSMPTPTPERNLLTGYGHTIEGSDSLIAGAFGSLEGDRSVLFSLDGDAHSVTGDGTFWVYGDTNLEGSLTVEDTALPEDLSLLLDDLGTQMALGDIIYRGASLWLRLVGNTTTTKKFLRQTGTGSVSAAPGWDTVALDDLSDVVITAPATDDVLVYDGAEWVNGTAPGGGSPGGGESLTFPTFTAPVDGDFSWVNQGSASIVSSGGGGLYLRGPAGSSVNFRIRIKAAPSTPYTITTAMLPHILKNSNTHAGMVFRQASDGKLHTWGLAASTVTYDLASQKWTNATTFSANYAVRPMGAFGALLWLRVVDDGANRVCSYSFDGWNWTQIHSIGRTDFLTATEVGFYIGDTSNLSEPGLLLLSWEET